MKRGRSLCDSTMDGMKVEQLNRGIIKLTGMYTMSVVIIIYLAVHVSSLKQLFDIGAKYETLSDKTKSLRRATNETEKNMHTEKQDIEQKLLYHCITRLMRSDQSLLQNSTKYMQLPFKNYHKIIVISKDIQKITDILQKY